MNWKQAINVEDSLLPIVAVDDDESMLDIIKRCYSRSHLKNPLITLDNGEKLLLYLEEVESGSKQMPALVLLDVNMPRHTGFDILQVIRLQRRFHETPVIIMLSVSRSATDLEQSRHLGANGYQIKPDTFKDFIAFFDSLRSSNPH